MDFEYIHKELAKPNITLTLLHDEYVSEAHDAGKIPYAYRTFTEHYRDYAMKYKATMGIRRKPGELLEVDWAGATLFVVDSDIGKKVPVCVFIATLPYSQLFYVEGSYRMDLPSWIKLHQHAFDYFGGVPNILVPDNLKTGVTKHTSKELILNKTYAEMVTYYNAIVMPAHVLTARDKASVEGSVNIVTNWIIQALRNVTCFTLEEEKFALSPLPNTPYKLSEWRKAKVRPDYHK
ncbi:IS21 family transposase [Pseudogracilibacillus auburnensis]|uniref:IS21 family transposase n=1 Tax=Pseudogracilibacillus auburnensis TaxID=1494959 RepID=UPI001F60A7D2|nr:IS21 family transposase [Pseudogracilibacillus auburnensis]